MAALAARSEPVRGMAAETLARLVTQARLQAGRAAGGPAFALRPAVPGKGFDLLPAPDPGDIFYDIEGDPHVEGGLEYLHGLWAPDTGFRAIWAHDRDAERAALVAVLDAFRARIAAHPGARIYHYAAYEVTALRRLTALHGVGEAFLDRLLRERRFVDLYAVVRGGVLASEPDYSIKSLEVFTGIERAGEVKTAGGSVVAYERWLEEARRGDPRRDRGLQPHRLRLDREAARLAGRDPARRPLAGGGASFGEGGQGAEVGRGRGREDRLQRRLGRGGIRRGPASSPPGTSVSRPMPGRSSAEARAAHAAAEIAGLAPQGTAALRAEIVRAREEAAGRRPRGPRPGHRGGGRSRGPRRARGGGSHPGGSPRGAFRCHPRRHRGAGEARIAERALGQAAANAAALAPRADLAGRLDARRTEAAAADGTAAHFARALPYAAAAETRLAQAKAAVREAEQRRHRLETRDAELSAPGSPPGPTRASRNGATRSPAASRRPRPARPTTRRRPAPSRDCATPSPPRTPPHASATSPRSPTSSRRFSAW